MISNRPKYLKAILFTNNLAEVSGSVVQSQCFTLQDYHYHCYLYYLFHFHFHLKLVLF